MTNYYKTLGVKNFASNDEIKAAYRKLSKKFHPDLNKGDEFFEELFKGIQIAYEALNDIVKRERLDNFLRQEEANLYQNSQRQRKPNESQNGETSRGESNNTSNTSGGSNEQPHTVPQNPRNNNSIIAIVIGIVVIFAACLIVANENDKKLDGDKHNPIIIEQSIRPNNNNQPFHKSSPVVSNIPSSPLHNEREVSSSNGSAQLENSSGSRNFSIGSSKDEVLRIQGNPTSVNKYGTEEVWRYDFSSVKFINGRVNEYSDISNNLKVKY